MTIPLDRISEEMLDSNDLPIAHMSGGTVQFTLCHLVWELHRRPGLGLGEIMELFTVVGYSDLWRDAHCTCLVRSKLGHDCDCIIDPTLLGLHCSAVDALPEG